jgi:anti-sigma regulatory factor (Ser/Thr protein kinase)
VVARESIPAPLRLGLSGPSAVHDAVGAARSFAHRAGLDDLAASRLAIVVEELAINLYDHGGLGPADLFELELSSDGSELSLSLVAPGPDFDPTLWVARSASRSTGAGAGLNLVKAWSGRLEHEYAGGYNRLALTLPIGDP